jgi:hypothetical protein
MFDTPTHAVVGQGFQLSVATGTSPVVITPIGQLRTAKRSGSKTKILDITNTDSPRVGTGLIYDEMLPVSVSPGDVDFSGIMNPSDTSQILLQTLQDAGTLSAWTISLPASGSPPVPAGVWSFNAYVTEIAFDVDYSKEVSFSGKLTITGPAVYTVA